MSREGYSVLRASRAGPCGRNEPAPKAATSVRAGGYTDTGRKLENQDTFKIQQMKSTGDLYVSVLDGHGANGKAVAHQARDLLYEKIERAKDFASDRKTSMKQACIRTHAAIVNGSIDASLSGTTATYAVINRAVGELVIGCVGDTRAIIGRKDASGKMGVAALTRDHNCDDPREAQRVRRAGGKVEPYRSGYVHLSSSLPVGGAAPTGRRLSPVSIDRRPRIGGPRVSSGHRGKKVSVS